MCIAKLKDNNTLTSARTVCETESRLYRIDNEGLLIPEFDDKDRSMIRRQDRGIFYKVYSTDVFRGNPKNCKVDFLGKKMYAVKVPKICGLDIDDIEDFNLIEAIIKYRKADLKKFLHVEI